MIIFTADWHLKIGHLSDYRFGIFDFLPKVAEEYDCRYLFVLGDVTDDKDRHPYRLYASVIDGFRRLSEVFERIFVLMGNHDYSDPEHPPMEILEHVSDRITFISQPEVVELDGLSFLCIPHRHDFDEYVKLANLRGYDFVLLHQPFSGAKSESGSVMQGADPGPFDVCSGFVLAGDIHVPQKVGRVEYVGAPYHVRFGDAFEPRVIVSDGKRLIGIPTSGVFPAKRIVRFGSDPVELHAGDYVKFRVTVPAGSKEAVAEARRKIVELCKDEGAVLCGIEFEVERGHVKKIDRKWTSSMKEVFDEYCVRSGIEEEVASYGRRFLQ